MTHPDQPSQGGPGAIEHEVTVPVPPETAFDLYVERPARTHPTRGLSGEIAAIVYEPHVGGRWYERARDGSEHDWGRVLAWEPGRRLTLAWMVDNDPTGTWALDPDPEHASTADITFTATDDGGTRVRVVHSGLRRHRSERGIADDADGGWAHDLDDLARAAADHIPRVAPAALEVRQLQVNLFCVDPERCAAFYEALGMPRRFAYPPEGPADKIEVETAGVRIGFDRIEAANRIADLDVVPASGRSTEITLWVPDVDAAHARAVAAGARSLREPMTGPGGRLRWAWVTDPEGHQVRFTQEA